MNKNVKRIVDLTTQLAKVRRRIRGCLYVWRDVENSLLFVGSLWSVGESSSCLDISACEKGNSFEIKP